jgi:hypothetical protein
MTAVVEFRRAKYSGPKEGRVATPLLVGQTVREKLSATSRISTLYRLSGPLLAILALTVGTCVGRTEQSVSLAWDANPETNIVGYRLYYGTTSQSLTNTVNAGLQVTATVIGLREGETYYFAVTAFNSEGLESDFSDQVSYPVPAVSLVTSPPGSPGEPMRLGFDAVPGYAYEVMATEDFETWVTVYYTTPTLSGWREYVDLDSPLLPKRFYRLIRH